MSTSSYYWSSLLIFPRAKYIPKSWKAGGDNSILIFYSWFCLFVNFNIRALLFDSLGLSSASLPRLKQLSEPSSHALAPFQMLFMLYRYVCVLFFIFFPRLHKTFQKKIYLTSRIPTPGYERRLRWSLLCVRVYRGNCNVIHYKEVRIHLSVIW